MDSNNWRANYKRNRLQFLVLLKRAITIILDIRFTGINGAFAAGSVWFNIADGSVGTKQTGISADIKDYGNGWYRISATKEATASHNRFRIRFQLASSNNDYNVVGDG